MFIVVFFCPSLNKYRNKLTALRSSASSTHETNAEVTELVGVFFVPPCVYMLA